jgi:hypothetical protein
VRAVLAPSHEKIRARTSWCVCVDDGADGTVIVGREIIPQQTLSNCDHVWRPEKRDAKVEPRRARCTFRFRDT